MDNEEKNRDSRKAWAYTCVINGVAAVLVTMSCPLDHHVVHHFSIQDKMGWVGALVMVVSFLVICAKTWNAAKASQD